MAGLNAENTSNVSVKQVNSYPSTTQENQGHNRTNFYADLDKSEQVKVDIGQDRFVVVSSFKGKTYIHVRQYYFKKAKCFQGIVFTPKQSSTLVEMIPVVQEAIGKTETGVTEEKYQETLSKRRKTNLKLNFCNKDEAGCSSFFA
ncbi:hypothetical protein HOLleu_39162 [Holothuria leucospilota]|uniref:Transcriptional coactivator p15 (PC4) C-terminal domain-containing protein n=1 Tax=Holothuria leucospilota TaxID=206669 RepID=A0A9Q0YGY1_HOLLE|nr:hypothetical protein HOLleu_39162 [Holothuria leucospilota]